VDATQFRRTPHYFTRHMSADELSALRQRLLDAHPHLRELFLRDHAELLEPEFWQTAQRRIESGELMDFFPYPASLRLRSPGPAAPESVSCCCTRRPPRHPKA
jgi:hypothetical protein